MSARTGSKQSKKPSVVVGALDQLAERFPQYSTQIKAVAPYVTKTGEAVDTAYPYFVLAWQKANQLWELAQPYHPQQYGPLAFGLVMCLFGASYLTLIAAFEAVRLSIWQQLYQGLAVLYNNYKVAKQKSIEDDKVDADGNGIADVEEISDRELLSRKVYLFARTVDPKQVSESLSNIWAAVLAVVATLRVHFARAITLGTSLGELAESHLSKTTLPIIDALLPTELKKWTNVLNDFMFKFIGIMAAWFLSRIIAGFHACMRGANMFVTNAIILAKQRNFIDEKSALYDEKSASASALATGLAVLGFWWQMSNGFGVPFPLNLVLFPVTLAEWMLSIFIGIA